MAGQANVTTDHGEIRRWAEQRDGHPARVIETGGGDDAGILRIEFDADGPDPGLEQISWDEWFETFDANDLAFLYQDDKVEGEPSTFNKIVSHETAEEEASSRR